MGRNPVNKNLSEEIPDKVKAIIGELTPGADETL